MYWNVLAVSKNKLTFISHKLIYNQGHAHIKMFDSPPDVQMYCCKETYWLPPAWCSRLLLLPNVVLFVMRAPSERRLVELN